MAILLGCIADDYTGASDLANTLTKNGLRTVQTVGIPAESLPLNDVDAVVISLKIRSVAAEDARQAALQADQWLRAQGASHVMYKICSTFDSTDTGNIGPVTEALLAASGDTMALVTPAFPETGRTVYFGHLFVNGQLLSESPLKDHPLNPMHDANLVRVLQWQSRQDVGLVDLATIRQGDDAIRQKLQTLGADGKAMAIADAIFEDDLVTLGRVAITSKVSTGASGLGLGLARALAPSQHAADNHQATSGVAAMGGLSAIVVGSCSKATLRQLEIAEKTMPVRRLDPKALLQGDAEIESALDWAASRLDASPVIIAASATPADVAALQAEYGRDASGHAIERATSLIAFELVKRGVRRLVVAGGETSGAAVDRLQIPAFRIGPEIAAGVPILQTIGDAHGGLLMALKSGNFGGETFFSDALAMMQ